MRYRVVAVSLVNPQPITPHGTFQDAMGLHLLGYSDSIAVKFR
ncbi:MAG: hypothetical protein ACKO99_19750 [Dolichospermum sp.]